jgi:hypothetical protein
MSPGQLLPYTEQQVMGVDIMSYVAGDGQAQQNLKPFIYLKKNLGTLFPSISWTSRLDIAEFTSSSALNTAPLNYTLDTLVQLQFFYIINITAINGLT